MRGKKKKKKSKPEVATLHQELTGNASINWGYHFLIRDIAYNQIYIFSLREILTKTLSSKILRGVKCSHYLWWQLHILLSLQKHWLIYHLLAFPLNSAFWLSTVFCLGMRLSTLLENWENQFVLRVIY